MKLEELKNAIKNCNKCLFNEKTDARYCGGTGSDYRVMFICESPSTSGGTGIFNNEANFNATGADKLFNEYKQKYSLQNCYTTDFVKCGVPNEKPTKEKIKNCSEYLMKEIEIINPKVIIAVGKIAFDLLTEHIHTKIPIIFMHHYSYIYRWCRNKEDKVSEYDNQFKEIINILK